MAFFENIEIQKLFCAEEADTFPPFTEKDLAETEKAMGWKLPASYLALLNIKNGGRIDEAFEESWLSVIYGISSNGKGLADWYDLHLAGKTSSGSTSGSIPTLAFHSGKHSRQGMTCILWITEPWTRTASLGLF